MSESAFGELLKLMKGAFPEAHLPLSFNSTKNVIKDLGLHYEKIHAYPNSYMLYWAENKNKDEYHTCGVSRWVVQEKKGSGINNELEKLIHKVPANVMRYFPLNPRLQRLFMCKEFSKIMRWHAVGRKKDWKLRHPTYGEAWKMMDAQYPDFSSELQNVNLGILFNISGKSKDYLEERFDLQEQNIRKPLHPVLSADGKSYEIIPAIFDMTKKEKEIFCSILKNAKLPYGCASNISRYLSISEKKVVGYKSHDAHFILHYLLQFSMRRTLKPEVVLPLIKLGTFIRGLWSKVFDLNDLEKLQKDIVHLLFTCAGTSNMEDQCNLGETEDTMSHSARNASLKYHIGTKKNQEGKVFKLKHADWKASHQYVLFNSDNNEIESLIRERMHTSYFWIWLKEEVQSKDSISRDLEQEEKDKYGLTKVNFNKLSQKNDPYVLSSQVQQVFYVQDPIQKMVQYVIKKLPRDVCDTENENATEEEIRTSTLDDIDIDPGLEFEVGDGSCFRDDNSLLGLAFWSVLTVVGSSDDEKHTMDDTTVNVRLHYKGKFKKTSYVGGKHFILMGLDVESFSYSVLMELVKDNLHFTEIGGIYANKGRKGGWHLLSNDKQVMALVEDCAPSYLVNFYIDNIVDKQIEPAPQMQPHPSENEKVTARRKLALEPCAGDIEDTGNKDVVEKLPLPLPLSEYLNFKKAGCRGDSEDTRIGVSEKLPLPSPLPMFLKTNMEKVKKARYRGGADKMLPPPPPLCDYKNLKLDKMRANNEVYKSLRLPQIVSTFKDAVESSSKSKGKIGKEAPIEEDDSKYVLANEGDVESDDSSEDSCTSQCSPWKIWHCTERAAAMTYCQKPVKPTSTKIFRHSSNDGPAPGTIATYFTLRDRQMNNDEAPMNENIVEFEMEQNADEEVQEGNMVHGRNPNEKVVIPSNAKGQAISDIERDVAELSNFLGTLARDNVSLTYVDWHVVLDQLKQKLWEYTLGKYVIPDKGRKWVYTTLSNVWKL
ncbi:hypothetical protein AgCh_023104 [Apium graveolens]